MQIHIIALTYKQSKCQKLIISMIMVKCYCFKETQLVVSSTQILRTFKRNEFLYFQFEDFPID